MEIAPTQRLKFRPLTADDSAAVLHLFNRDPDFAMLGGRRRRYSAEETHEYIGSVLDATPRPGIPVERHAWLLLQSDGELAGVAEMGFVHPVDGIPWIGLLQIRADLKGNGLGRDAVGALEAAVVARNFPEVGLSVLLANEPAQRFWEKVGYHNVGERGDGAMRSAIYHKRLIADPHAPRGGGMVAPPSLPERRPPF